MTNIYTFVISLLMVLIIIALLVVIYVLIRNKRMKRILNKEELRSNEDISDIEQVFNNIISSNKDIYYVKDAYIPHGSTSLIHIPYVLFTKSKTFVIYPLSFQGIIKGKRNDIYWDEYHGKDYQEHTLLKNPLKENEENIHALNRLLSIKEKNIQSIIIFLEGDISHINLDNVLTLQELEKYILLNLTHPLYEKDQVYRQYQRVNDFTKNDIKKKKKK